MMIERNESETEIFYTLNGAKFHRANGPALIWKKQGNSGEFWYLFGKCHRYYGPRSNRGSHAWWVIHDVLIKDD
jgi:hypothetical protein